VIVAPRIEGESTHRLTSQTSQTTRSVIFDVRVCICHEVLVATRVHSPAHLTARAVIMMSARAALVLSLSLAACACSRGEEPVTEPAPVAEPILTRVTAERTDLMYRYRKDDGYATATTIDEIPAEARRAVNVIDLSLSPEARGSTRLVQIFDLSAPSPDGSFPGRLVPRGQLEAVLAEAQATPAQAPVTMYSAAWCGVCTKARAFMTKSGIAFVEKDVDKDKGAARELAEKARRAGIDASGVPVFDVGGTMMPGFDQNRLMSLVRGG